MTGTTPSFLKVVIPCTLPPLVTRAMDDCLRLVLGMKGHNNWWSTGASPHIVGHRELGECNARNEALLQAGEGRAARVSRVDRGVNLHGGRKNTGHPLTCARCFFVKQGARADCFTRTPGTVLQTLMHAQQTHRYGGLVN